MGVLRSALHPGSLTGARGRKRAQWLRQHRARALADDRRHATSRTRSMSTAPQRCSCAAIRSPPAPGTATAASYFAEVSTGIFEGNDLTAGAARDLRGQRHRDPGQHGRRDGHQGHRRGHHGLRSRATRSRRARGASTSEPERRRRSRATPSRAALPACSWHRTPSWPKGTRSPGRGPASSWTAMPRRRSRGNSLCDNGTDLRVDEGNPTTLDGNEVCPPDASPAASG